MIKFIIKIFPSLNLQTLYKMPCAPHTKVRRSEFTQPSSSCGVSSPSSSSSSASVSSMESEPSPTKNQKPYDLSVYSDDVIQAQKHEHARQYIDKINSPFPSQHCKDCNLYLDGRIMDRCGKKCCEALWYRYRCGAFHPILTHVYMKQANGTWMLHKSF